MKFVLVGHFCFDVCHPAEGEQDERLGGIFNAASMLSLLSGKSNTIVPVCGIARDDFARVASAFEDLPGVSTDGLYKIDMPTNRVHVFPGANGQSVVCSKDIAPPIPFERLRRHIASDGMLVNMISGFDITLETLDQIRIQSREERTVLHFDFHNLTLGKNDRNERYRRPLDTWRRWAFMVDTIQLNEEEIAGLDHAISNETSIIGHMLTLGVKGVVVTRGSRGLTVYVDSQKHVVRQDLEIEPFDGNAPLGSGDQFGAAFFFNFVTTKDIIASAHAAASAVSKIVHHK